MASVAPPKPGYRPHLPAHVVSDGLLSDAQIESVICAGEAHACHLAGSWTVEETFDVVAAAREDDERAVRFRRGWFLGDGTGAGKGRQVAGILLDNWLKGRRAVWVSKSDTLIYDARRDWAAIGQESLLITPLFRFHAAQVGPLLDEVVEPINRFLGDGAYDRTSVYATLHERHPDAAVVVPPRTDVVLSATAATTQRDRHIQADRQDWTHGLAAGQRLQSEGLRGGSDRGWKQVIGGALRFRFDEAQATEVAIAAEVLNRMLDLGRPNSVRIA